MSRDELPVAIRATSLRRGMPFGRRRKYVWEARLRDGTLERDVDIDHVLQCGRCPADGWATRHAAEPACGTEGRGPWIEYPTGYPLVDDGRDSH
ncbi:hypothetical protein GCM10023153_08660 [Ornithinibacter aureus]|uniref:HNH endonuclease n=1 Tax=Ornithinibacter aureus TaxID=622664 RepID=A0ABP8JI52_9MICO